MTVYGVVNGETQSAVELFVRREDAGEMVENWRRDERRGLTCCGISGTTTSIPRSTPDLSTGVATGRPKTMRSRCFARRRYSRKW
jgi:hypothetical protein